MYIAFPADEKVKARLVAVYKSLNISLEEVNPTMRWLIEEEKSIAFMAIKLSLPVMLGFVPFGRYGIDRVSLLLTHCGLFYE